MQNKIEDLGVEIQNSELQRIPITTKNISASEAEKVIKLLDLLEENESEKRIDKGLLFLSLALFVWAISGCWVYINNGNSFFGTIGYTAVLNLFSVLNNIFLLFALSYFYYAPKFIYQNKRKAFLYNNGI